MTRDLLHSWPWAWLFGIGTTHGSPSGWPGATLLVDNDAEVRDAGTTDIIIGTKHDDHLIGTSGDDSIDGRKGADTMLGGSGNDSIVGGSGNDRLDGGLGADTLVGGTGNDTFLVDDALDTIVENVDEGVDTVNSGISWTLGDNFERLVLTGSASLVGTGNDLDNKIDGNKAADQLDGGAGHDTLVGHRGADTLTGGLGNDSLDGGADADSLDGGTGADTLVGGTGDDTILVDDLQDSVVELSGGGIDTVVSVVDWTLEANVENLTLNGWFGTSLTGIGNQLGNVIHGDLGVDYIDGAAGDDTIVGSYGISPGKEADTLLGGEGDDFITKGGGFSWAYMYGGMGNDTLQQNEGAEYGEDGDDLLIGGIGQGHHASGNSLYGGTGNDTLNGGSYMDGGDGDDVIDTPIGSTLTGGLGNDTITGTGLVNVAETLRADGGGGHDYVSVGSSYKVSITGGSGNDTLEGSAGSSVTISAGAGDDQVSAFAGGGAAFTVDGGDGADSIIANGYGGTATGGDGNDTIRVGGRTGQVFNSLGGVGDDTLSGGAGLINSTGGAGTDTFILAAKEVLWQDSVTVTDFAAGVDHLAISEAHLPIGNGDQVVDGAVTIAGPGGFDASSELVIVAQDVIGALTLEAVAAAIGDANQDYSDGQGAVFVVGNGSESWVVYFESGGQDAHVSAGELSVLAHLVNGARPQVDDVGWTG